MSINYLSLAKVNLQLVEIVHPKQGKSHFTLKFRFQDDANTKQYLFNNGGNNQLEQAQQQVHYLS